MTTTVTGAGAAIVPLLVEGYSASRRSGNLIKQVLGTSTPAVVLRPAALRAGVLRFLFATSTAADTVMDALAAATGPLALTDTDHPRINMTFVLDGDLDMEVDPTTMTYCWVSVPFQETQP